MLKVMLSRGPWIVHNHVWNDSRISPGSGFSSCSTGRNSCASTGVFSEAMMKTNVVRNLLYGSVYFQFFCKKNKNTLFEGVFVLLCFCVFVCLEFHVVACGTKVHLFCEGWSSDSCSSISHSCNRSRKGRRSDSCNRSP